MVESEDTAGLLSILQDGVYFADTFYRKRDVARLLKDKESWLYKHLFVGANSVKGYFSRGDDIEMDIGRKGEFWMVVFVSKKKSDRAFYPDITLRRQRHGWIVTDLFGGD